MCEGCEGGVVLFLGVLFLGGGLGPAGDSRVRRVFSKAFLDGASYGFEVYSLGHAESSVCIVV